MAKRIETRREMLYISMAVDQRWWSTFIQSHPYAYHQTADENVGKILQQGLMPWNQIGKTLYDRTIGEPRPDHIYLRLDMPRICQIKVDLKQLNPSNVDLDEDALDLGLSGNTPIEGVSPLPEHLLDTNPNSGGMYYRQKLMEGQQSLGEYAESQAAIIDQPANVQRSIPALKTFAYRGSIPPQAVSLNEQYADYNKLITALNSGQLQ